MEHRNLGISGLRVSVVGLGCNNFGGRIGLEASREVIHKALDLGVTLFDTADVYGREPGASETVLGQSLSERRGEIVLATKFGSRLDGEGRLKDASRRYVAGATRAEQVAANVSAAGWALSGQELEEIDRLIEAAS
jgi:aryl-alcohol dehydrogenase-like predicted oxidoreductase